VEIEAAQPQLLDFLSGHAGIGFMLARGEKGEVCFFHREGRLCLAEDGLAAGSAVDFLRPYGDPWKLLPDLISFAGDALAGDLILFGAYDGERIACFDDQVGGHGSVGGEQLRPFVILPKGHPVLEKTELSGYDYLYREVFLPAREPLSREAPDLP
jgi:hypothetical protein